MFFSHKQGIKTLIIDKDPSRCKFPCQKVGRHYPIQSGWFYYVFSDDFID